MKAPHPQLSAIQNREAPASRGSVPAASHAGAARALVPRLGEVGRLGGRENFELDALDGTQLLGPPVIELPLARRGPNALGLGIGQSGRVVIPGPVTRGNAVRPLLLVGWDPPHAHSANASCGQGVPISGPKLGVPGNRADLATTLDTLRLIDHPIVIRDQFQITRENLEGHEDGEQLSTVHCLDGLWQGPGNRVRRAIASPESACCPP